MLNRMQLHQKPLKDFRKELLETVSRLCVSGKGLIEVDECESVLGKVFSTCGVPCTLDSVQAYRELIVSTPQIEKYISGLCFSPETLTTTISGVKFLDSVTSKGIVAGVRADRYMYPFPGTTGGVEAEDYLSMGLDSVPAELGTWYQSGVKFAIWRSTFKVTGTCMYQSILENVSILTRFASMCQEFGIVPVVEIEISHEGDFSIEQCQLITERVLTTIVRSLIEARVFIEGCVLCPSLVTSGSKSHLKEKVTAFDIGSRTYLAISRSIPSAFPGVMLINPCLCEEDASLSLCEMTKFLSVKKPWILGFCYSSPYITLLKVWEGKHDNVIAAQESLIGKLSGYSTAALGQSKGCKGGEPSKIEVIY